MKTLSRISLIILLALATGLVSCKKYEDGPVFSLASKKSRVVNTWKIEELYSNGADITGAFLLLAPNYTVEFNHSNVYTITWANGLSEEGIWAFDGARENILLDASNSSNESRWKILRLKKDEFWAEYQDGNDILEAHLMTK